MDSHLVLELLLTMSIPRDIQEFLAGYPDRIESNDSLDVNYRFYANEYRCRPDNLLIEELLEQWSGNYDILEHKHGYIQWLFPIQEYGMNWDSSPLQPHEIQTMTADTSIIGRLLRSYQLMLDFYGMRLESDETGLLSRTAKYKGRYHNLSCSVHNNLRISRILKCLSEFGLECLNAGFLLHVLNEQSEHNLLNTTSIRQSMDSWWANCLRNAEEREWMHEIICRVREGDRFFFTRQMYEEVLQRRKNSGAFRRRTRAGIETM